MITVERMDDCAFGITAYLHRYEPMKSLFFIVIEFWKWQITMEKEQKE